MTVQALAEAMYRTQFSDPHDERVDRQWMRPGVRGHWEYRAALVLGLVR